MIEVCSYKDLIVWQKSIDLVVEIYKITDLFPKYELFNLTTQMRRSGISISSNIAEGKGRGTRKDFSHFLKLALGSANELETQIEIAKRLDYIEKNKDFEGLLTEIMKMLNKLISSLDYKTPNSPPNT